MLRIVPHSLSVLLFGTCYFLSTMSTGWIYNISILYVVNAVYSSGYVLLCFLLKSAGFLKKVKPHSFSPGPHLSAQHEWSSLFSKLYYCAMIFLPQVLQLHAHLSVFFPLFRTKSLKFFSVKTIHVVLCGLLFLAQKKKKNCVEWWTGSAKPFPIFPARIS